MNGDVNETETIPSAITRYLLIVLAPLHLPSAALNYSNPDFNAKIRNYIVNEEIRMSKLENRMNI